MRRGLIRCVIQLIGGIAPFASPAGAVNLDAAIVSSYSQLGVSAPTAQQVTICHGFGCARLTPITITETDRARLRELMGNPASPRTERTAAAAAVAWFERRVAPAAGTANARARANGLAQRDPSQFDCVDASRNTTSLLVVLEQLGLLRYHSVAPIEARGFFLDGRYPHATAVLRELRTGQSWAVDSWTHNNGEKPDVMPLDAWLKAAH
jgi:hypothetical protein